ncbi:hypothetical protein QQ73_06695, partial [Candidatus Endoriftia persephone str. Guaymas]|nr:hypothetical protein [Candidatus Endoriftia persephone str. Guaymas]
SAWVRLADPAAFDIGNSANVDDYKFRLNIKQSDDNSMIPVAMCGGDPPRRHEWLDEKAWLDMN